MNLHDLGSLIPLEWREDKGAYLPLRGYAGQHPDKVANWQTVDDYDAYGICPHKHMVILDLDGYKQSSRSAAKALHKRLPATLKVTARDDQYSYHAYYKLPEGFNYPLRRYNHGWGEVIRSDKGEWVYGPGSPHVKTKGVYKSNGLPIATLPWDVALELVDHKQTRPLQVNKSGKVSKKDREMLNRKSLMSRLDFAMAISKGDGRHMAATKARWDTVKAYKAEAINEDVFKRRMERLYQMAVDADCQPQTIKQLEGNYAQGVQDNLPIYEDDFWSLHPAYGQIYDYAIKEDHSPWGLLFAMITVLATGTDYRISMALPNRMKDGPVNLYTALVGGSSSGKSSGIDTAINWARETLEEFNNVPRAGKLDFFGPNPRESVCSEWSKEEKAYRLETMQPLHHSCIGKLVSASSVIKAYAGKLPRFANKSKTTCYETGYAQVRYNLLFKAGEAAFFANKQELKDDLIITLLDTFYSSHVSNRTAEDDRNRFLNDKEYALSLLAGLQAKRFHDFINLSERHPGWMQRFLFADITGGSGDDIYGTAAAEISDDITLPTPADWQPVKRKSGKYRGYIRFEDEANTFLKLLARWGRRESVELDDTILDDRIKSITYGHDYKGHTDTMLARTASMLARLCGVPMNSKGRVTIPQEFFEHAIKVLNYSSQTVRGHVDVTHQVLAQTAKGRAEARIQEAVSTDEAKHNASVNRLKAKALKIAGDKGYITGKEWNFHNMNKQLNAHKLSLVDIDMDIEQVGKSKHYRFKEDSDNG